MKGKLIYNILNFGWDKLFIFVSEGIFARENEQITFI